jgi:hypothetical protein
MKGLSTDLDNQGNTSLLTNASGALLASFQHDLISGIQIDAWNPQDIEVKNLSKGEKGAIAVKLFSNIMSNLILGSSAEKGFYFMKIIKKRAIIISLIVIIFTISNTVVLSHQSYRQLVATMQYPQDFNQANIIEGRILIPLRPLVEMFGAKVEWNPNPNSQGDGESL